MSTTVAGCGAPAGGYGIDGVDATKEAVVQGVVTTGSGSPVPNAYVRLLDRSGEFTAEVQTSDTGSFRFFASTGTWTLRVLAPKADRVDQAVEAETGKVVDVAIKI